MVRRKYVRIKSYPLSEQVSTQQQMFADHAKFDPTVILQFWYQTSGMQAE